MIKNTIRTKKYCVICFTYMNKYLSCTKCNIRRLYYTYVGIHIHVVFILLLLFSIYIIRLLLYNKVKISFTYIYYILV